MAASTWSTTDKNLLTLSNGNLTATTTASTGAFVRGKDPKRSGKYYFESTCGTYAANSTAIGIGTGFAAGNNTNNICVVKTGTVQLNNVGTGVVLGTLLAGNVVCIAVDLDATRIWFRVGAAGNWNNNVANNPATGVGGLSFSALGAGPAFDFYPMFSSGSTSEAETANFGATAFTGAVPAGFTSGWDDSVTAIPYAVTTQVSAEHWLTTNPDAQTTQIVLEHWGTVTGTGLQAIATQIALEHWASVAVVPTSINGPFISMIG